MSLPQERTYYGRRLMERREEAGLDPFEMAAFLGIQPAWYFDLEAQDDLLLHFPLSQVARLLEKLDLSVEQLFSPPGQEHRCSQMFNLMDLLRGIRKFQEASRISVPESKAYLSYDLDEALADPATVWDWTVECIQFTCDAIGWDWLCVALKLPSSEMKPETG